MSTPNTNHNNTAGTGAVVLPAKGPLLSGKGWTAFFVAVIVVCAVAPVLNLLVPEGNPLHMSDFAVALVGKIMCYAIAALAMDLIWGYTGILSLGHGLFFALGGYMMGMYLMRQIGLDGNYKSELPDFMVFLDWKELPWHWTFSGSFIIQALLVVLVPGVLAGCLATSPSARASKGCISPSSPRRSPSPPCCCSSATKPALVATTASPTSSASSTFPWPHPPCA